MTTYARNHHSTSQLPWVPSQQLPSSTVLRRLDLLQTFERLHELVEERLLRPLEITAQLRLQRTAKGGAPGGAPAGDFEARGDSCRSV